MRPAGRAALPLLLLLLLLVPPSAEAAGLPAPSLRGSSSGARPRAGGVPALLLLLPERPPHPSAAGRGEAGPAGERPRRDDPALSIDLTFHLLRTLLELARTQSQRERAEQNRVLFEAVGK